MDVGKIQVLSVEKSYEIIDQIRSFPAIWDVSSREYRDNQKKVLAFQAIAKEVGLPVAQVREKYRNLRTYYVKEKKKVEHRKRNSRGQPVYQSRWEFYETLDAFLASTLRYKAAQFLRQEGLLEDDGGEMLDDRADFSETGLWFKNEPDDESWDTTSEFISPEDTQSPSEYLESSSPNHVTASTTASAPVLKLLSQKQSSVSDSSSSSNANVVSPEDCGALQPVSLHRNDSFSVKSRHVEPMSLYSHHAPQQSADSLFGQVIIKQMETLPEGRKKELLKLKIQRLIFETKFEDDASDSSGIEK